MLWKHQSGGFLPDQGTGEGLPGHVSVDVEAVADASARRGSAAEAQSASTPVVDPAPAMR